MLSAQRALLAASLLLCLSLFKHLWDIGSQKNLAFERSIDQCGPHHCHDIAGVDDVVIILKTGSTEIYEKLPHHLATTLACDIDYLVYSDLRQRFAHVEIRDAMALVSQELRDKHEGLAHYRLLQQHVRDGGDPVELKGEKSWRLDKWKFLPMVSDAYRTFGESKKWYVFVEADTYLSLHNLRLWLRHLPDERSVYAGAQIMIGDTEFAHGGSGILVSSTAAKGLASAYHQQQRAWEHRLAGECCGDKVMAEVMLAVSPPTRLLRSFPLIQGETLASLDWSPNNWCMPAVTWHHVDSADLDRLWHFELDWQRSRGWGTPIMFADYFAAFVHPRIVAVNGTMRDWDNLSGDWIFERDKVVDPSYESAQACETFCRDNPACLQWTWTPNVCRASKAVRLGWALRNRPALGSAEDRVAKADVGAGQGLVSGWLLDRIDLFRDAMGPCKNKLRWITENEA